MYDLPNVFYVGSVDAPLYRFRNRGIVLNSPSGVFSVDTIGNELSVDTFTVTVRHVFDVPLIYSPTDAMAYRDRNGQIYRLRPSGEQQWLDFSPKNSDKLITSDDKVFRVFGGYRADPFLLALPYGTPVFWFVGGDFQAKGYSSKVERVGRNAYRLTCISGIGLLDSKIHKGGVYTGQKFSAVAADIIGDTFGYAVTSAVRNVLIYGHLPYDSARKNLHRLLFATGASIVRPDNPQADYSRDYSIRFLGSDSVSVPQDRVSLSGSISYQLPANAVEITEHGFYKTPFDEEVTVFDNINSAQAENQLVVFRDSPVYDVTVATGNLVIHESGVNHAVVSGTGTLVAKKYTHSQQIVRQEIPGSTATLTKRVTENEIVSTANSRNVAKRVLAYFSSAKTIKAKLILAAERCGVVASTYDAFGELTEGIIQRLTVRPTSIKAAEMEIVDGYTPTGQGNNFTQREFFAAAGTWTAPADMDIQIVLIGGGDGGERGQNGQNGAGGLAPGYQTDERQMDFNFEPSIDDPANILQKWYWKSQPTVPGGAAGTPGKSGKILVINLHVTAGQTVTITPGVGGAGGYVTTQGEVAPVPGTATTAVIGSRTYTSDNGVSSDYGFYDALGDESFALPGEPGHDGGEGGRGDAVGPDYCQGGNGFSGGSVGEYAGGAGGVGKIFDYPGYSTYQNDYIYASGGAGGGAAWGSPGNPGGDGREFAPYTYRGGVPGDGANAVAPDVPTYGSGGGGGNGGGSGGNCSGCSAGHYEAETGPIVLFFGYGSWVSGSVPEHNAGGKAGKGSHGGKGGAGCAIIYS